MLRSLTERRPVGCLRVPRTRRLGASEKGPFAEVLWGQCMSGVGPCARGSVAVAVEVGGDVAPRAAVLGGAVRGELGMVVRGARGPRASWRASGGPCLAQDSHRSHTFRSGEDRWRRHIRLARKLLAEELGWCGPSLTWAALKRRMSFDPLTCFSVYSITSGSYP